MNRLLDLEEQNHDAPNDTPLRGYHPRFRRSELLNVTKPVSPIIPSSFRKSFLQTDAMRWTPLGFPRALLSLSIEAHAA
ncbi:unnamed protein product [Lasius platythorax]|uniref:Uncharacterized protein n=1 Tax=Lasius platythorax TaxID=488582 RepID=A0AAV2P785_9HYME